MCACVNIYQKPATTFHFRILKCIANGNPQVGDLKSFVRKMNQHYGCRMGPCELGAFAVQTVENATGEVFLFLRCSSSKHNNNFISANSVDRKLSILKNNADPVQDSITLFLSTLFIEFHEIIQINKEQRKGRMCTGTKSM